MIKQILFCILLYLTLHRINARCPPGPTGATGFRGAIGPRGITGATGARGATGAPGDIIIAKPYREFHVALNGSDLTGTGSVLQPFRTIQFALDVIGSASNTVEFNNITTGYSTVYIYPGSYTENLVIPTRQVIVLNMISVKIIGNIAYNVNGAVMSNSNGMTITKLILRGGDAWSTFNDASLPDSSTVQGDFAFDQTTGTSGLNGFVFEMINAGVIGNIDISSTVSRTVRVYSKNSILTGDLTANAPTYLHIRGSDQEENESFGGVIGNAFLYVLSHVWFLRPVILTGNGVKNCTWYAVKFDIALAHDFSGMHNSSFLVDDNSYASYLANVPTKGDETFTLVDTLTVNATRGNSITTSILPTSNNLGTMFFDQQLNIPLWRALDGWKMNNGSDGIVGSRGPLGNSFQVDASGVLNNATIALIKIGAAVQPTGIFFYSVTNDTRSAAEKSVPIPLGLKGDMSLHLIVCFFLGGTSFQFQDFGPWSGATGATGANGATGAVGPTGSMGSNVTANLTLLTSSEASIIVTNPTSTPVIATSQKLGTSDSPTFVSVTSNSFIGKSTLDVPLTGGHMTGSLAVRTTNSPAYTLDLAGAGAGFATNTDLLQSWYNMKKVNLTLLGNAQDSFGYAYSNHTSPSKTIVITLPAANVAFDAGVQPTFFGDQYVFFDSGISNSNMIIQVAQGSGDKIDNGSGLLTQLTLSPSRFSWFLSDGDHTWISFVF